MELSFWSWLCGDSSGVLLRQRIPEVALFCGCRLEAWYHNVRGMVAERPLGSVSSLLERFKEVSEGPDRPIAILRHESKGNPREGIPGGTIVPVLLSLQRFTEILREVVEGRIVTLQSGSLSGVWTLQSYVEPRYGLRFLSVYTCDAQLEEKHDAFSQPFQKCYTLEGVSPEPWKGRSEKFRLDAPQLDAIESKTLGIVRYAHRFHKIDLEGILLEFVVDQSGRLAVHACWSASICNARESRRFRSAWPEKQGRVQEVPRTFNVPRLEESFEMDWDDTLEEPQGFEGEKVSVDDSKQNAHAVGRARNFPALLLEFWQGDTFLGEASFGRECTASSSGLRTLNILPLGHAPPLRSDGRKLMADGAGKAIAVVSLRPSEEGRDLLTFKLGRAEGLPVIDHEEKVQAVLWTWQKPAYVAVWSSSDSEPVEEFVDGRWATVHVWNGESVDLTLPPTEPTADDTASSKAPRNSPRPSSARQSPTSQHTVDEGVRSYDHVCGAELAAHWGMSEDGMRGHLLASQIWQRMKLDRSNRSGLVKRLAQQVVSFHNLQRQWELCLETAHHKEREAEKNFAIEEKALQDAMARRDEVIEYHKQRMVAACRRLYTECDEYRERESAEAVALAESQQRVQEQRERLADLSDKSDHFAESLKQVRGKVDALLAEDVRLRQKLDEIRAQHLASHHACMRTLSDDLADLATIKADLMRKQRAARNEHKHILKMEDFVRRVANQDTKSLRTGGGFVLNSMAKTEAQLLVQELFLE